MVGKYLAVVLASTALISVVAVVAVFATRHSDATRVLPWSLAAVCVLSFVAGFGLRGLR